MNQEQILGIIKSVIAELYAKDSNILTKAYDIHERTITHRLAMYLEPFFVDLGFQVDVEYNRMRDDYGNNNADDVGNIIGKRLNWEDSEEGSSFVYPDIIVHKRDSNQNYIEIEVKMSWKNRRKDFDYFKINEYMSQLGYEHGIYIELAENIDECLIEFGPFELN